MNELMPRQDSNRPGTVRPNGSVRYLPPCEGIVSELCSRMFVSLPRSDQRRRGEEYVRGLLTTPGRKSIRNIASHTGGEASIQRLHHFVAGSTWDWQPIRAALATYLEEAAAPTAWVVHPLAIPKSGEHSVGVGRRFLPQSGQVTRGQHALGVWFATPTMSASVNWRLLLPQEWARDSSLRRRAEVPENVSYETLEQSAVAAVAQTAASGVVRQPVLLDIPGAWTDPAVLRSFNELSLPLVARITASTRLFMANRAMPGFGTGPLAAEQMLTAVRGLRRRVEWYDFNHGVRRTSLAVMVQVAPRAAPGRPLYLLGEWDDPWRPPTHIWLTDLAAPVAGLLRLTKTTLRVRHDLDMVGNRVGLRDFEGRSFPGWHRHTTLASVAHTACLLMGTMDSSRAADCSRLSA